MHFGKLKFSKEISIANAFNMFFSDNVNKQNYEIHGVPLQSEKLVYLSELLNITKLELTYTLVVKLEQIAYDTNDNLPASCQKRLSMLFQVSFTPSFVRIF